MKSFYPLTDWKPTFCLIPRRISGRWVCLRWVESRLAASVDWARTHEVQVQYRLPS